VDNLAGFGDTIFNVRDYGAVGDGVTDDTTSINLAVSAAVSLISDPSDPLTSPGTRAVVDFPRGTYRISSAILVTADSDTSFFNLAFRGDGMGVSILAQHTPGAGGVIATLTGASASISVNRSFEISDLTFRAQAICGRAIFIDCGTSTSFHQKPGSRLVRVSVQSPSVSFYWTDGVKFNESWNSVVESSFIAGNPAAYVGTGIELTGLCVNFTASNSQINFWDVGFKNENTSVLASNQNNEGVILNQLIMVPVSTGVYVKGNPNADWALQGLDWAGRYVVGRTALVTLSDSHIDARGGVGTAAVKLENVNAFMITSNMLIVSDGGANVIYLNEAYEGTCTGNTIFGPALVAVKVTGKSTNSTFTGNQFRQGGDGSGPTAFEFDVDTQFNVATNNTRENQYALINTDNSTAAGGESNNLVGQSVNISSVVTTTLGGTPNETFSVDISRAALGRKSPAIAVSLNGVVTNIGVLYDWTGIANSKTVARIRVYTLDGTNLPGSTSYRLGLSVNPGTY
jgi:hypothetical protein